MGSGIFLDLPQLVLTAEKAEGIVHADINQPHTRFMRLSIHEAAAVLERMPYILPNLQSFHQHHCATPFTNDSHFSWAWPSILYRRSQVVRVVILFDPLVGGFVFVLSPPSIHSCRSPHRRRAPYSTSWSNSSISTSIPISCNDNIFCCVPPQMKTVVRPLPQPPTWRFFDFQPPRSWQLKLTRLNFFEPQPRTAQSRTAVHLS